MIIFLLTSFISFLIVSLALLITPSKSSREKKRLRIPRVGVLSLYTKADRALRRGLTAATLIFIFGVAWYLFSGDLSSRSPSLPNFLFGLIFGPVFAIWLGGIFHNPSEKFSVMQAVQGSILVVLFVVGLLGAETARLAEHYSRRISKVGVGGAEIAFADLGQGKKDSGNRVSATPPPGYKSGAGTPNSSPGLGYLAQLDDLIERDCGFVAMADGPINENCLPKASNPANAWSVDNAVNFAGLSISSYARCLVGVFDTTLDDGMVVEYLRPLAVRFQELSDPSNLDSKFVERAVRTHLTQTRTLLTYLFPVFLNENVPRPADAKSKPSVDLPVRKSCATLVRSICDPSYPFERPDFIQLDPEVKPAKGFKLVHQKAEKWVSLEQSQPVLRQCQDQLQSSPDTLPQKRFADYLKERLEAFYQSKEKESGFESRPYVAIAHASLMVQLGQQEAGISRLYEWVDKYERDNNLDSPQIVALGKNAYKVWYAIRARSLLFTYMDRWLSHLDEKTPDIVRDLHLANLQRYLELLRLFPPAVQVLKKLDVKKYDLEGGKYTTVATDFPACEYDGDYETAIIFSHLATGNLFAYHALRHRKYDDYSSYVRKIVRDAMNVDTSCIAKKYSPEDATALRSEALELQAEILMHDAEKQKTADDRVAATNTLKSAEAAVNLALRIIGKSADADIDSKKQSTRFVEKIGATKVLIARETALHTRDAIFKQLEDLR
jgi:hypothetical protein